jgi:hypothetical protein
MSAGAVPSSEYLIQTIEVGATPASTIEFLNLGQYAGVYRHLQIVVSGRFLGAYTERTAHIRLNGDTGANYNRHFLVGTGSGSPVSGGLANSTSISIGSTPANNGTSSAFSAQAIEILDSFNVNKYTTVRTLAGNSSNATEIGLFSGAWRNTAVITSIQLFDLSTNQNWAQYSRFSLYGVTA